MIVNQDTITLFYKQSYDYRLRFIEYLNQFDKSDLTFKKITDSRLKECVEYNQNIFENYLALYNEAYNIILDFMRDINPNYYNNETELNNFIKNEFFDSYIYNKLETSLKDISSFYNDYLREEIRIAEWKNEQLDNAHFSSGVGWMTSDLATALVFTALDKSYEEEDREKFIRNLDQRAENLQRANKNSFIPKHNSEIQELLNISIIYQIICNLQKMLIKCYLKSNDCLNLFSSFIIFKWKEPNYTLDIFENGIYGECGDYSYEKFILDATLNPSTENIEYIKNYSLFDIYILAQIDFDKFADNFGAIFKMFDYIQLNNYSNIIQYYGRSKDIKKIVNSVFDDQQLTEYKNVDKSIMGNNYPSSIKNNIKYKPLISKTAWLCTCGTINKINNNQCSYCNSTIEQNSFLKDSNIQEKFTKNYNIQRNNQDNFNKEKDICSAKFKSYRNYTTIGLIIFSIISFFCLKNIIGLAWSIIHSIGFSILSIISAISIFNSKCDNELYLLAKKYKISYNKSQKQNKKVIVLIVVYIILLIMSFSIGIPIQREYEANTKIYNIAYSLDGGTNNSKNITNFTRNDEIKVYEPTKYGYKFYGWYLDAHFSEKFYGKSSYNKIEKDLRLYAKWQLDEIELKFYYSEGNITTTLPTKFNYRSSDFVLPTPTKNGYTFCGWISSITKSSFPTQSEQYVKKITYDYLKTSNWSSCSFYAKYISNDLTYLELDKRVSMSVKKTGGYFEYCFIPETSGYYDIIFDYWNDNRSYAYILNEKYFLLEEVSMESHGCYLNRRPYTSKQYMQSGKKYYIICSNGSFDSDYNYDKLTIRKS